MPEKDPAETGREVFRNLSAVEEAEQRAYRRGKETADLHNQLEGHFKDDDQRFREIKMSQDETKETLKTVVRKVDDIGSELKTAAAVTSARAQDAKKAAETSLSTRTFLLGLAGLGAAILTALAASGHL